MKTAVVIPVLNEGQRLIPIATEAVKHVDLVIIVDDGSEIAKSPQKSNFKDKVYIVRHAINLGKGAALKTGIETAIKLGGEIIVLMDGDGQHNPQDIPRFLSELENKKVDVVFGSRIIGKDMPFVMMFGNKFLSLVISYLFRIYISDTQSGFRALRASAYPLIKWDSTRYSVETEMIVNVGKKKLPFSDISIGTIYKDNYKGTTIIDGIRIFINILFWKIL